MQENIKLEEKERIQEDKRRIKADKLEKENSRLLQENIKLEEKERIQKIQEDKRRIIADKLEKENSRLQEEIKLVKEQRLFDHQHEEYLCPITWEIMTDPVIAADGRTYERQAILHWFQRRRTSPMTNLPMNSQIIIPNIQLKNLIAAYKKQI